MSSLLDCKCEEDIFTLLYSLKKRILMLRHYVMDIDIDRKLYSEKNMQLPVNADYEELCSYVMRVLRYLRTTYGEDVFVGYDGLDYTYYTDVFYGNKFWNEIENDVFTETVLARLSELINCEEQKEVYVLALYDFHDYCFSFKSEKDVEKFIDKFDCIPYTLYQAQGTYLTEIRSE